MKKAKATLFSGILILCILSFFWGNCTTKESSGQWPRRVLITNDDGIDTVQIGELARAFAKVAQTYVIAPHKNRSGSSHYISSNQTRSLVVEKRDLGEGIMAYAVKGYPADCVLLALSGIMKDNPPDLVISGVNTGPNIGDSWMWSGTIGAARVASFAGFPAIAVSGLFELIPEAVASVTRWVVRLAQSPVVRSLEKGQFLAVSFPIRHPAKIKGVRLAQIAETGATKYFFEKSDKPSKEGREVWKLKRSTRRGYSPPSYTDVALYMEGYIVITPMRADEQDMVLFKHLEDNLKKLPEWPPKK